MTAQARRSFRHREAGQLNGAYARYRHCAIGGDGTLKSLLRSAPHIDDDLVASAETIVGRRGHILVGFKRQVLLIEDIASKDLLFAGYIPKVFIIFLFLLKPQELAFGGHETLTLFGCHAALISCSPLHWH